MGRPLLPVGGAPLRGDSFRDSSGSLFCHRHETSAAESRRAAEVSGYASVGGEETGMDRGFFEIIFHSVEGMGFVRKVRFSRLSFLRIFQTPKFKFNMDDQIHSFIDDC